MKTKTPLNSIRSFVIALTIVLMLISGATFAADQGVISTTSQQANRPALQTQVAPAGFSTSFNSDDGIPLAREDVIPLQTANGGAQPQTVDDLRNKISSRATNAQMQAFLARTNMQQLMTAYREASQMIDTRHVSPPSYEVRTRGAVQSVVLALQNNEFLRVNNVNQNPMAMQSVQAQLQQMAQAQPARDVNGALALMQTTAEVVNRATGIRREAVALEFFNGTMDSLDKYSALMPDAGQNGSGAMLEPVQTAGLEENIVGVGVELKGHAQGVEIVGVVDNSPASELGLQEGDLIVAIGQQSMVGKTLNDVADRLAGPAGSPVSIDVNRNGKLFRGTMVRRKVHVSSVSGTKMIDQQTATGYIRLKQFSESSATDLERALFTLHNQGMKNLVLDLRGNPGGLLDVCVTISDMFLTKGVIVSTRGRNQSDNTQETANFPKTWAVPMVVLVDENSASASEIFAAAMQENQRAIIVGRTSYGKGTVQTHFPMTSVPVTLKLTTAKFYSPNGREMAGAGVTPDVPVTVQTTAYRGTDNDADVQTAAMLINRGAPSQLMAGTLNVNQLNMTPPSQMPTYAPVSNGYNNFPGMNIPNRNQNVPGYSTIPSNNAPRNFNNFNGAANRGLPNYRAIFNDPSANGQGFGNGNYTPDYNFSGYPGLNNGFGGGVSGNQSQLQLRNVPGYPTSDFYSPQGSQNPGGWEEL